MMNVFELAGQYKQLEALVDGDAGELDDDGLLQHWLTAEGDLNIKIENIGFAIRNREAILAGKQEAIKRMEGSAMMVEKEIERLENLAISILTATNKKKAGGDALTLSVVPNAPKVIIENLGAISMSYFREVPAVPANWVVDKKKIADDLKEGVVVEGAHLQPSVRLAIK